MTARDGIVRHARLAQVPISSKSMIRMADFAIDIVRK